MKRYICAVIACVLAFNLIGVKPSSAQTERQIEILDAIVEVCAEHWEDKHGYASTCAMMAYQESGCGQVCRENNLWGLNGGKSSYPSLRAGIEAWLRVINLDYYPGATSASDCDEQLAILLDNGYCQPVGAYYANCMKLKRMYNLGELDDRMFSIIEKKNAEEDAKKRKEKHQGDFKIVFDDTVPVGTCVSDSEYIKKGSTVIFGDHFYEVCENRKGLKNTLIFGKPSIIVREMFTSDEFWGLSDQEFKLQEVIEDAVG